MENDDYELLDSGDGRKLERFGDYFLSRPASHALWKRQRRGLWKKAHATYTREGDKGWESGSTLPESWSISLSGIRFTLKATDFGHLGIFPEQRHFWRYATKAVAARREADGGKAPRLLNLFAYSGGSTLAAALGGAEVVHLDASKGMVAWARENGDLNALGDAPIRWIADDVTKFMRREERRGSRYDAIILDPPTFGRGTKGELFKIEEHLVPLLASCRSLLSDRPLFVMLSCHTPGYTPTVLHHLLDQAMEGLGGAIVGGELFLEGGGYPLPSGGYARWSSVDE